MPTIPMGNFGQSVAQPQRAARSVADTGLSDAIGQVAQTVQGIAINQIAAQTRLDQEAREVEAQTNAGRVRVKTINDAADLNDEINRGILDGTIPKEKAAEEWSARFKELTNGRLDGMDPRYAGPLQVAFEDLQARGLNGVRDTLTKRDQQDTQANLLTLGEEYQRMAVKDRPRAVLEYTAQVDAMGPRAGWTPEQIALKKQQFREGTAYTQAFGLAKGAQTLGQVRDAQKALVSDAFADISPQKRMELDVFLTGKESALIQKAEHAANAAARAQEARMSRARAEFEAAQGRLMTGIPDNDAQLMQTVQALSGTPYMDTYKAQQNQARTLGGFASKSIPEQQREVDALYAERSKTGGGEQINERIRLAEKALSASKAEAQQDNLRAYVRRTPGEAVEPIDVTSPQAFITSVKKRVSLANRASLWSGNPSSVLMSDEAPAVAQMLGALPVQQRATALATIGTQLGPQASAGLAAQIDKQDKALALALQYGSSKTTAGRYTSELILKGQAAINNKVVKVEAVAVSGWRGQIAKMVDDAYASERQAAEVREAAYLITAGMAAEGDFDPARAVRLAAGGDIVEHNGKKIPLPAGVTQGDLEDRLRSLKPQDFTAQTPGGVVRIGGQETTVDAFVQSLPDAQLISVGRGRYAVQAGGRVVTNAQGRPITVTAKP